MPTAYVAQRLDYDEPLWGWHVRDATNGWLQGAVTLTTFTTWSMDFEWDSDAPASGLPAARLWNARVRNGEAVDHDAGLHVIEPEHDGESLAQLAARLGFKVPALVALNKSTYKNISGFAKLKTGTPIRIYAEEEEDYDHDMSPSDTPREVAKRHKLPLSSLLAINREAFGGKLDAETKLNGSPLLIRDRDNEASSAYLTPSSHLLHTFFHTPSHAFSHPLTPSHVFSRLFSLR